MSSIREQQVGNGNCAQENVKIPLPDFLRLKDGLTGGSEADRCNGPRDDEVEEDAEEVIVSVS